EMLEPQLAKALAGSQTQGSIGAQVKWILKRLLAGNRPDILAVARELGINGSGASLQYTRGIGWTRIYIQPDGPNHRSVIAASDGDRGQRKDRCSSVRYISAIS